MRPAFLQAARPAAVGGGFLRANAKLIADLAEVVQRVGALIVLPAEACRPARIERIERMLEGELFGASVAVVGIVPRERPPRAEKLRIDIFHRRRRAIDVRLALETQLFAATEEVQFLDADAGRVLAALASIRDAGIERPDIVSDYFNVDDTVVPRDRPNIRVLKISRASQNAFRLLQQPSVVLLAFREEQLAADRCAPRAQMQLVGEVE